MMRERSGADGDRVVCVITSGEEELLRLVMKRIASLGAKRRLGSDEQEELRELKVTRATLLSTLERSGRPTTFVGEFTLKASRWGGDKSGSGPRVGRPVR